MPGGAHGLLRPNGGLLDLPPGQLRMAVASAPNSARSAPSAPAGTCSRPSSSPASSFVRGYEPYTVATQEGRLYTGTLARETVEALFLNGSDAAEVRIPRDRIEDLKQGQQSIMPQGLDGQLTRGELADLLAFLQSLR